MTTVVHLRKSRYDVYIGRGSIFGNPYVIGKDGDRAEVIKKFRVYFANRLEDEQFRESVVELHNKVLACYCAPLACHGDVIVEFLDKYIKNRHTGDKHV